MRQEDMNEHLRLGDFKPEQIQAIGQFQYVRLAQIEQELPWEGIEGDMTTYLAGSHESIRQLSERLGVARQALGNAMDVLGIARLSKSEALSLAAQRAVPLSPERDAEKRRKLSEASKRMWQDPESREKILKNTREANATEEVRRRKSEAGKKSWTNERKRRVTEKAIANTIAQWNDPEKRKNLLEGDRRRWKRAGISVEQKRTAVGIPAEKVEGAMGSEKKFKEPRVHRTKEEARELRRQSMLTKWQDPAFRERHRLAMRKLVNDEDFRRKRREGSQRAHVNPEYEERRLKALAAAWKDPVKKNRQADAARRSDLLKNADPEFQARAAQALRDYRSNPENAMNYPLNTIRGWRKDIEFEAISAWEANFARVLKFMGREFYTREAFTLDVDEQYKDLIKGDKTLLVVDFVTAKPNGEMVAYEIMAHPRKDPMGVAKLEMLKRQHPEIQVRVVSEEMYKSLRRKFENKINHCPAFCGWEKTGDNLKTNPQKYT